VVSGSIRITAILNNLGIKGLYRALNEFLNTGKLKMPDGTILLDISPDEARKVVKLLTWAGGYIP